MNFEAALRSAKRSSSLVGLEADQVTSLEMRKDFSTGGWTAEFHTAKSHYVVRIDSKGSTCDVFQKVREIKKNEKERSK